MAETTKGKTYKTISPFRHNGTQYAVDSLNPFGDDEAKALIELGVIDKSPVKPPKAAADGDDGEKVE